MKVFTGTVPFSNKLTHEVAMAIVAGERPHRPIHPGLGDGLWTLAQTCWDQEPRLRPKASDVLRLLWVSGVWNRPLISLTGSSHTGTFRYGNG